MKYIRKNNTPQIKDKDYIETSNMLESIRRMQKSVHERSTGLLREEKEDKNNDNKENEDAIAITNDPKFGQEVLKSQQDDFRSVVDGGAEFADEDEKNPESSPLIYIPSNGNLVFSGTIPSLNNLKWQFSLKDSDGLGLFIWADGFRLTKENMEILNKLQGHYLNWKDYWQKQGKVLDMIGKKYKD